MSCDNSDTQIVIGSDEKNSEEGQYECINEDVKDRTNTASSQIVSNISSDESQSNDNNDNEIIEAKQDNTNQQTLNQESQTNNIKQGYKIINKVNSSSSEDNSREEDATVTFSSKIKEPIAQELKTKIIDFIRKVQQNPKIQDDMSEYIQDHIYEFEHVFQEIFQENQATQKLNGEAIEVIIIKPLHDILIQKYAAKQDKRLEFYFRVYEFITLNMFEIDQVVLKNPNYTKAVNSLIKIDSVKTPKEKLNYIVTSCTLLSKAVQTVFPTTPIGADQLLPMLIFSIIQAKPEKPYANLLFIKDFRCKWRMKGMEQYYVATYESALEFIDSIDAKKLRINENVFDKMYSKNYEKYKGLGYLNEFEQKRVNQSLTSAQAFTMLKKTQTSMLQLHSKMAIQQSTNPLQFVNQPLSTLKLTQLPEIYAEYQMLVDSYKDMIRQSQAIITSIDQFSHNDNQKHIFNMF